MFRCTDRIEGEGERDSESRERVDLETSWRREKGGERVRRYANSLRKAGESEHSHRRNSCGHKKETAADLLKESYYVQTSSAALSLSQSELKQAN